MIKKCIGCGKNLQNEDKNKAGYTPNLSNTYCMRCFRLKNYGEKSDLEEIDTNKLLNKINKKNGLVFFMIDYLNINKSSLNIFKSINLPKILVISKSDTLRKDIKFLKIKKWLKDVYNIEEDIVFLSNKNDYNNLNIFKIMDKYNFNTCFIMGITNAGKSTFMNNILKKNNISKEIIVSSKPNTTLDFIKFNIDDYVLYDTPGFNYANLNIILDNIIKPITYNLKKSTNIIIEKDNIFKIDSNSITLYFPNINIKREYKDINLKFTYNIPENSDIVINGLGFINIKKATTITSNLEYLEIRPNISGGKYE
ncbi:MAG: 50S ribosome-binding GTPase [Ruminococcus sp.]|nr:50S ribosome-binding GTPase [Ruminococcus sp.]